MPQKTTDNEGISSLLYRLAPRTLRGRLIGTTVVVALVVVGSTFTIASALNARMARVRAESEAAQTLRGLSDFLRTQAEANKFVASQLAGREIPTGMRLHDKALLTKEFTEALPLGAAGYEYAALDPQGTPIVSHVNDPGCLDCMVTLARAAKEDTTGPISMPDGPFLIASQKVHAGGANGPLLGSITVARPLSQAGARDYPSIAGVTMSLMAAGEATRPACWQPISVPGYTNDTRFNTSGSAVDVVATLAGVDGKPVTDVKLTQIDETLTRTGTIAWISIIASSIFAGIIGLSVGVVIADLVREPVDSMVGRVKKEGYRAIEGMPYSGVSLDNPRLPKEFRELGAVIDGLLYGLSARQAELKRVTAATQEAEEALAVTVNESVDAQILVQDGLIRIANPATMSHFGLSPRNLLGHTPQEVFDDLGLASEDGTLVRWSDLADTSVSEPRLVRLSISGRGERWLQLRIVHPPAAIKDRLLLTARDVTDSRRLEQLRSELISMISHDLRSPLTVIVGYLDLLGTDLPESARDKAITSARSSAMRMESMLDDLLSATRAEELFSPKVLLPVNLCDLAEDVATSMRATDPNHTIEVVCDKDGVALGEEKRLRQALVNLVGNAIKYAPADTEICIKVEPGRDESRVLLVVEDHGTGIPEDYKHKVFDRFARVKSSSAGKPGLGLGLYIVRVVAEGHGGRVHVEDTKGGGARFVMELPATDVALVRAV